MTNGEDKRALSLLRKCDVLSEIPVESLTVLAPNIKIGTYRPRQVIYLPGDRAQGVHFLTTGRIKISKVTRDGKELTLAGGPPRPIPAPKASRKGCCPSWRMCGPVRAPTSSCWL